MAKSRPADCGKGVDMERQTNTSELIYISPKELAERWQCTQSSIIRIARRAGFTKLCLGVGRNGMVRYMRKEVEEFEAKQQVKLMA